MMQERVDEHSSSFGTAGGDDQESTSLTRINEIDENADYLHLTKLAYNSSQDYLQSNVATQWSKNISNFKSEFPTGSKYHTAAYKARSRIYLPKTRSSVRQNEAAFVAAFFSTQDVVNITAEDQVSPDKQLGADLQNGLLNYRLEHTIDWFQTSLGAYQDAMVYNLAWTRQEWVDGLPAITSIPPENMRFDPGADWRDIVGTSPFLIELVPMYITEIEEKMDSGEWKEFDLDTIYAAKTKPDTSTVQTTREQPKSDSTDNQPDIIEFNIVWVYRVIMNIDGEDLLWYTLDTRHMLTDPEPVKESNVLGRKMYVCGRSIINSHDAIGHSLVQLGENVQTGINDNYNQRFDNIKLVLNSRHLIRSGAQIDLRALKTSYPGGLVAVTDINKDVKPLPVKDVTGSSYAEQDRMASSFDEIMGNFSQSSVSNNRNLNETVGGMKMLRQNSSTMAEYTLRVFAETWVKPVIENLVAQEEAYEDDQDLLNQMLSRLKLSDLQKDKLATGSQESLSGFGSITKEMITGPFEVRISVGFGATDPNQRMQRFMMALAGVAKLGGSVMGKIDEEEVIKEIFGAAGYQAGQRFFHQQDEEKGPPPPPPDFILKQQELKLKAQDIQWKQEIAAQKLQIDQNIAMAKLALEKEIKLGELYKRLGIDNEKINIEKGKLNLGYIQEEGRRNETNQKREELNFKAQTGRQGI